MMLHLKMSSPVPGFWVRATAAACIARGLSLAEFGPRVDPSDLVRLAPVHFERQGEVINARIIHVDNFGNLITSIPLSAVPNLFSSPTAQLTFSGNSTV